MRLIKNKTITDTEILIYSSFLDRLRGLMFKKEMFVNKGILLSPCNGIHMFFMNFPIDVVFIDKRNQIIKLTEGLKPYSTIIYVKHAVSCFELPVGCIQKLNLKLGHELTLK